jgi:glycosyltransferase involved in cell wall biosynthesis
MRVLHVVEATIAGVRKYIQALVTGLDSRRFQQTVACPLRRENAFGDEQFIAYLASAGVPVLPIAMQRSIDPLADLAALRRLVGLLRRDRYDLIHLHSSKAGFLGRLGAALAFAGMPPAKRPKVLYSPHGLAFLGDGAAATRRLYLALERLAGPLCDRIVAVSPSEREIAVDRGLAPAERVVCIDLGVDPEPLPAGFSRAAQRQALGVPAGVWLAGTVARATPQKNPFLFVDAAAQVLRQRPDGYFLWCGDGELRAPAERRARELGIADRCRFVGHREDAQAVLASFDLFWLTSNYESFGLATAEAMALGLPVVATDVVGTRDLVVPGTTGVLTPPRDPAALARATLELLGDPAHARSLAAAARARIVERYSLDRMLDATASLYDSLIMAKATPRQPLRAVRGAAGMSHNIVPEVERSTHETTHNHKS